MSDFNESIIVEAERLGATRVRIEPAGARVTGRFHRHPSIVGVIAGQEFRFALPGTVLDTRRRRLNYIMSLRHYLLERGAKLPAKELEEVTRMILRQASRATARRRRAPAPVPAAVTKVRSRPPVRLDKDPWAPLLAMRAAMGTAGLEEAKP